MCGGFLRGKEGLPSDKVMMSKVTLPELECGLTVEDDVGFGVEMTAATAGGAVAWAVEVVIRVGPEPDGVVCSKIVAGDEAGNGA